MPAPAFTHVITTTNLSNLESYATAAFTPAADCLLVVTVSARSTVAAGAMLNSAGLTFTRIASAAFGVTDTNYLFVSDGLSSAVSQTCTFTCTGDAATQAIVTVFRLTNMVKLGADAVRQSTALSNQANSTPSVTFSSSCLTNNPTLGFVGSRKDSLDLLPPTNWSEDNQTNISGQMVEQATRASGFTGTTITWGNAITGTNDEYSAIIIEFSASPPITGSSATTNRNDTSVASGSPIVSGSTATIGTITQHQLTSGGSTTDGTVYNTASVANAENRLLLLAVEANRNTLDAVASPTVTGLGLTWVEIGSVIGHAPFGGIGNQNGLSVFRALGSANTGALTITFPLEQDSVTWALSEFSNTDTSGTNGSGAIVQTTTNSGTTATSLTVTLAGFGSTNNATYGAFGVGYDPSPITFTQGAGFNEIHDTGVAFASIATEWRNDNDTSVDMTFSTAPSGSAGRAIELKSIGGVGLTNNNDACAASGGVINAGTSATTNANDVALGTDFVIGNAAILNNNDTSSTSGFPVTTGTCETTNNNDIAVGVVRFSFITYNNGGDVDNLLIE